MLPALVTSTPPPALMQHRRHLFCLLLLTFSHQQNVAADSPPSFGEIVALARQASPVVVLQSADDKSQVLVAPTRQGRVLTSTAAGNQGLSYGWVDLRALANATKDPGGEDRLWLGPMGTQYSLFFAPGIPFVEANWRVPPCLATGGMPVVKQQENFVDMQRDVTFQNHQGVSFSATLHRRIRIFSRRDMNKQLSIQIPPTLRAVGFESDNRITNTGNEWKHDTGLVTLWILGKFPGGDATTVVLPTRQPPAESIDLRTYLFDLDSSRLAHDQQTLYYRGDGRYRSKVGIGPALAQSIFGSYDAQHHVLTIIQYSLGQDTTYVSHRRGPQTEPYVGDVVNSYNNGPMDGSLAQNATFYELESSSPALPCRPQQTLRHTHQTYHFEGDPAELDKIAKQLLRQPLKQICHTLE